MSLVDQTAAQVGSINPFSGAAEGMNQGHQWAMQQAQVDIQKQQLQQAQQQHEEMKRQYQIGLGSQNFDKQQQLSSMPDSPTKKVMLKQYQAWLDQSGQSYDPTLIASLNDDEYKQAYANLGRAVGAADPDTYGKAMLGVGQTMSAPITKDVLEKSMNAIGMANRMKGAELLAAPRIAGAENSIQTSVLAPIKQHVDNYTSVLNKANQLNDPNITNSQVKDILESLSVANLGMGRGNISDAKLNMIIPNFSGTKMVDAITFLGNHADEKAATPLVGYTKNLLNSMLPNLESQIKQTARTQSQSKQFSAQFGNDAVQSAVRPYVSGDFFKQSMDQYFPDGKPDWLKYNAGNVGSKVPQAQSQNQPTPNAPPTEATDPKSAITKYGSTKFQAAAILKARGFSKDDAVKAGVPDDLATAAGMK